MVPGNVGQQVPDICCFLMKIMRLCHPAFFAVDALFCFWPSQAAEPSSASFPESRHRFTSRKSFQNWRLLWRLGHQWPRRPGLISSKAADINQRVSSVQTTVRRGCLSISIFVGGGLEGEGWREWAPPSLTWRKIYSCCRSGKFHSFDSWQSDRSRCSTNHSANENTIKKKHSLLDNSNLLTKIGFIKRYEF